MTQTCWCRLNQFLLLLLVMLLLLLLRRGFGLHHACLGGCLLGLSPDISALLGLVHLRVVIAQSRDLLVLLDHLLWSHLWKILERCNVGLRHLRGMLLQVAHRRIVLNLIDSLLNCLAQRILQLEKAGGFARSLHLQHLFKVKVGSIAIEIVCVV